MSRIPYLSALVPSDAVIFHSLDQSDTGEVAAVNNEFAGFDLAHLGNGPEWGELATGERYIYFDGTKDPLGANGGFTLKHLFIIAAYDAATFPAGADGYKGLFSQVTAVNGILAGDPSTNKFFDFSLGGEYRKSGVLYAASNMLAPVSGVPELVELKVAAGIAMTSVQVGRDRDFAARTWTGKWFGAIALDRVATDIEIERLRLYANLKTRSWETLGQTLDFPAPEIIFDNAPTYSRFYAEPLNYDEVTHSHTYEDGGKTFNQTVTNPPRRWQVEFNGITAAQAQVLDAFSENVRKLKTFNFYDYRRDINYTGVRVENYTRSHDAHKSWRNNCRFDLVKY